MYSIEELTSTLTKSGGWYDSKHNLLSVITGSTPSVSRSTERWWERSPSRPYRRTLPYEVRRHLSPLVGYTFDTQDSLYFGGYIREENGFYQAVSRGAGRQFVESDEAWQFGLEKLEAAKNGCFDNLQGTTWNAPVFFAELSKTTELVVGFANGLKASAEALANSTRSSRVRAWKQAVRSMKRWARGTKLPPNVTGTVAKLRLQWRYAVQTAVMDIEDASKTTASLLLDKSNQVSNRISATRVGVEDLGPFETADSAWGREIGLGLSLGSNISHQVSRVCHVDARAWFTAVRKNSFLTDANQLGLLNAPLIVWELSWLSFVADWVLDVGNFLSRSAAGLGFDLLDGGFSVFRRVSGEHSVLDYGYVVTPDRMFISDGARYESSIYQRYVWENPTPVWTPKIRMNTSRWLDAAALIRSIPLGRFRV